MGALHEKKTEVRNLVQVFLKATWDVFFHSGGEGGGASNIIISNNFSFSPE
jgi:hypothetical protein